MPNQKKRHVDAETFRNGPGKQTSLSDVDTCAGNHRELHDEYDLERCPNCNMKIVPQTTERTPDGQLSLRWFE